MRRLARKKIVFVIVEGPSDDTALGLVLNQVYDKDSVHVQIMHGDITTRKGVNSQNIISKLGNEIRQYASSQHYTGKHFKQIIHIVDTDGTYIPDENIINELQSLKPIYEGNGIYTADKEGIIKRNQQKRENLFRLRSCGEIWKVPYSVYYMSCNLDHVLYNKVNSSDKEKEDDAYVFAKKYRNNTEGFYKFICESTFSVMRNFKESWKYIEEDLNSLERYTNLCICVAEELKDTRNNMNQ